MIIAIDPGKAGAIAHLHDDGRFCCVEDMPVVGKGVSPAGLAELLRAMRNQALGGIIPSVIIEQVGAMPGQGVTSMFSFGTSYGVALGVVAALRLPLELVVPRVWKKDMGLGKDKETSRRKALQLFPDAAEMLKRKKDEGRAESLLLGLWYARRLQNNHGDSDATAA